MLNSIQEATLLAAVDRIIPADEYPSASQAGALRFITGLLEGDLRNQSAMFCDCLEALHQESLASQGKPLADLPASQQDAVLESVDQNVVKADWPMSAPAFLNLLIRVTTEGYYSDPANGGNNNALSWKMVGYDPGANAPDAKFVGRKQ